MKGLARIMEAVVASLVLLAVLPSFFVYQKSSTWNDANVQVQANDALAAVHLDGTLQRALIADDKDVLRNKLRSLLPREIDFSMSMEGLPNPRINVGCVCTQAELDEVAQKLAPLSFPYKGRTITLSITADTLDNFASRPVDVLLFYNYRNLAADRPKVDAFLAKGVTLLMWSDLTEAQANDGIMNSLFGLSWGCTGNNGNGKFANENDASLPAFRIGNYFKNLSGLALTETFSSFHAAGANCIAADDGSIMVSPGGRTSYMKARQRLSRFGKGRTLWIATYTGADETEEQQFANLTKAAFLWASGEEFSMDPPFVVIPESQRFMRYSYTGVLGTSEMFTMTITAWRIFY